MHEINETHDPSIRSWVESANGEDSDFPIQNLPFGVFRRAHTPGPYRVGVAIGEAVLDVRAAHAAGALSEIAAEAAARCTGPTLNDFMALGPEQWSALRLALSGALRAESRSRDAMRGCLYPQSACEYSVPAHIGDYTDFYTSIHHATRVGLLFRPDNPLLPNYKWVPIGYHGRSSTIGVSGQVFRRPIGQTLPSGAERPVFGPSKRLDYEFELGVYVGSGNDFGEPIGVDDAERHIFGLCLLNDWSARDIQAWEYQPLGPFLSKNFATTVSPWIVTLEALAPFRVEWTRPPQDPQPLPYLDSSAVRRHGGIDIQLEAFLLTEAMRRTGKAPFRLSHTSFRHAYWTIGQTVAHHTVNGCSLRPGDLLGTGTQSGPAAEEAGSLLELSHGGKQPIALPDGERRTFLEDGDTVVMRGWCEARGYRRIGFGECTGTVAPARSP